LRNFPNTKFYDKPKPIQPGICYMCTDNGTERHGSANGHVFVNLCCEWAKVDLLVQKTRLKLNLDAIYTDNEYEFFAAITTDISMCARNIVVWKRVE
jgi:hypothetical protein